MCGCKNGNKKKTESEIMITLNQLATENSEDFTLITFNAACGSRYVYSPTNALKQYGLPHYGRHTCNDQFYVHNDDIKRQPKVFVPVIVESIAVDSAELLATDTAIQLANENNIDLSAVNGTGKDGKILKRDVEALLA